jgi:tetratricopeptide (TPR) repeat protein
MPTYKNALKSTGLGAALILATGAASFAPPVFSQTEVTAPPAFIEAQRAEARGDYNRAEQLYGQSLQEQPNYTAAILGRARMRSWLKRFDLAIADYQQVIDREPNEPQALSGMAWTHAWAGNFDEARTVFEYLQRIEPYYLDAQKGLAYVDLWRGNAKDARRQFEVLASEDKGNPDYVLAIAQASYMEGDLPGARTRYEEALTLKPDMEAARNGLRAVELAQVERRPALTLLGGRSDSGDTENSGLRMAQIAMQVNPDLRLWAIHDRGVGFDGLSEDRRALDSATTTIGGFWNYRPRMGLRLEAGVRDLVDETQPVFAAEQVFFLRGGTTPKVGIWLADSDEAGTQYVANISMHRWLGDRFAIEPTVYFGDDGSTQEVRGALLASYTMPNRVQIGLGGAFGNKDTPFGNRSVDRIFGNASFPLGMRTTFQFYGWRESTEGSQAQTVLAAGFTVHL